MILVGEMRDLETISTALTAAETGHLVFATLHTQSAPSTIDRIIDVFPAEQQEQVRIMIASSLQGIVTQTLLPTADGMGRVAALEVLLPDDAVRNLIRQGEDRAGLLDHADQHRARHADDGAGARRAHRCAASSTWTRRSSTRAAAKSLSGILERAGVDVNGMLAAMAHQQQLPQAAPSLRAAGS